MDRLNSCFISFFLALACSRVTGQPAYSHLFITGDARIHLYIDGVEVPLANGGNYGTPDDIDLGPKARLIAVHGEGNGLCSGILASTNTDDFYTDYKFRCTPTYYPNWNQLGFEDHTWMSAFTVGTNTPPVSSTFCPKWVQVPMVEEAANWVWTAFREAGGFDSEVYCRGYLPVCDANPCQNDGYCNPNGRDQICECRPGYVGEFCETHLIQPCGDLLHLAPPELVVPSPWSHYCFLGVNDTNYVDYPCSATRGHP
jgi:hypothetical protein